MLLALPDLEVGGWGSTMVLGDLGSKITTALRKLQQAPVIDDELLDEVLKEIGRTPILAVLEFLFSRVDVRNGGFKKQQ